MSDSEEAKPLLIAGIGASAGGLDALRRFFRAMPGNSRLAFIVVQHLDPNHESLLAEILSRDSDLTFHQATDQQKIEANCAYIIPPNAFIEVTDHCISITKPPLERHSRLAIDHLFRSMAGVYGSKAVGLLFSGTGSDGTAGLRELKAAGGLVFVQDPKSAEYASMPRSAIDAGVADRIEVVEAMPELLVRFADHPYHKPKNNPQGTAADALTTITSLLKARENIDLNTYKQATVERRILRRMSLRANSDYTDYIKLLRNDLDERRDLLRDLLINVTDFFRDKEAFDLLDSKALRNIVERAENGTDIRVWVAGCASGEEAYTIAILLHERIKHQEKDLGVKIFATDVDEEAIRVARKGRYSASIIAELPEKFINTYFNQLDDNHYVVNKMLRESVSFALQNVYADPPFSKVHLVSCRNLLIYFRRSIQQRVLKAFYFALRSNGYLFLGSSENVGEHKKLFKTLSQKWRIYERLTSKGNIPQHSPLPDYSGNILKQNTEKSNEKAATDSDEQIKNALLRSLPPSVVVDENNRAVYFHGRLDKFIRIPEGQANFDFITMLDEELRSRVRSGMYKARKSDQRVVVHPPTEFFENKTTKAPFQMVINPLTGTEYVEQALTIAFEELSPGSNYEGQKKDALESTDQDKMIDAMEKELVATREELRNTIEELENSTEELKASHEESITTNEELQSSNEELEASTEELRSLNEELTTVNTELKETISKLSGAHDDIKNFFASTNLATIFLSQDLRIKRFTPAAERLLNIGQLDIDQPISDLSRALLQEETLTEAATVLNSLEPAEKELRAEDGRWFIRKILPYQTEDRHIDGVVITFSDITALKTAVNKLQNSGQQQAVIANLGIKALGADDIDHLMDQLVKEITFTLNADYCEVLEYQPDHHEFLLKAGTGWARGLVGSATVPADAGSQAGFTLSSGQTIIVADLNNEKRFRGSQLLLEQWVTSGISCVIENARYPYGVLGLYTKAKRKFTRDDASFIVSAANILSVAIQRKTAESQLRENEKRLRIAKDSNRMGSFEYFVATGETYWDAAIKEIWGLDKDSEVTQNEFLNGLHPDDIEHTSAAIDAATQPNGDGHYHTTYRVINKKTSKQIWVEASGQVIFENGKPLKMIGMVLDITGQKNMELSLQSAVEELKKADERKNEFLAILGHELRNPLAAISTSTQVLESDESKSRWAIEVIKNNLNLVSSLLNDLLDLTRVSRGQIKIKASPVELGTLVSQVAEALKPLTLTKNQTLNVRRPEANIVTMADPVRLEQVLNNILSNAHKFTPEAGKITVALRRISSDECEIYVEDTGIGIDQADQEKIFEPFHQLKRKPPDGNSGMGIGLALVKQLVTLHHGNVSVASKGRDKGTKVTIKLPVISNNHSEQQTAVPAATPVAEGRRILVVDDNADAAEGLSLMLKMQSCKVKTCLTGREALDCVAKFAPDVLILDLGLPDMDGCNLLLKIRELYPQPTTAIALTGFGHDKAKEMTKKAGFDVHMAKPADFNQLLTAVTNDKPLDQE